MIQLSYQPFQLPLKHVFTISRGSVKVQDTLIVQVREGEHCGYGEATTNTYYNASIETMSAALERVRSPLAGSTGSALEANLAAAAAAMPDQPFALCALDMALHDLWARQQGQPLYKMWGLDPAAGPLSNYTIGIDTIPVMVQKMAEVADWPIYKIKLGTKNDLDIVRELRQHTPRPFRVDANCGWTAAQTIDYSGPLKELGVEFIEQPLPRNDPTMREVFIHSALPVLADESCASEADVEKCVGQFHGVNIKLVKCGGLAPARRMIAQARSLGMKVMCGCMTESTVGISAMAQLVPQLDYVDMDGAALLAQDIATGVLVDAGVRKYPNRPGTGAELLSGPI